MASKTRDTEAELGAASALLGSTQPLGRVLTLWHCQPGSLTMSLENIQVSNEHIERREYPSHTDLIDASIGSVNEEKLTTREESSRLRDGPLFSLYDRFGWLATTILIITTVLMLGAIGFLWFLWMSDQRNKTWHGIAVRNWITRAVTLTSVVVRTSVSLQATAGTSMLAGLALENTQILILHLASVSMMRNVNAGPYLLLLLMFKAFLKNPQRWRQILLPVLILLLAIVSLLSEFTSTTLLSDLKQGTTPGHSSSSTTATNFVYDTNGSIPFVSRGTVWTKKPAFYPAFAEYHQDSADVPGDTIDTGLSLRAFLPIQTQEQRSMLRNFSGRATVVDSHVRCVRPQITMEKGHYAAEPVLGLSGQITVAPGQSTNFSCVLPFPNPGSDGTVPNEWQIGVTYLGQFPNASVAPIQSVVRQASFNVSYGMAFLVVNVTAGSSPDWLRLFGVDAGEFGLFGGTGAQPKGYRGRQNWADLLFTANESLIMSTTLCYASYDSAVLEIIASGGSNRTEPFATYDAQRQSYDYSSIRRQLGQAPQGPHFLQPEERGLLSILKRDSWLPGPNDYADSRWLLDAVELKLDGDPADTVDYFQASATSNNMTAYLYNAVNPTSVWEGLVRLSPDPSVTGLFQQILENGGDIAFALQSILTVFTGMMYYDQLQQFNSPNKVELTPFIVVSRPHSIRGITAVTIVLVLHLMLMSVISYLFLSKAVLSTIGNSWQALAQLVRVDALGLVETSALVTDGSLKKKAKQERWKHRLVGLKFCGSTRSVKLVSKSCPDGLAKMMKNAPHRRRKLMGRKSKPPSDRP